MLLCLLVFQAWNKPSNQRRKQLSPGLNDMGCLPFSRLFGCMTISLWMKVMGLSPFTALIFIYHGYALFATLQSMKQTFQPKKKAAFIRINPKRCGLFGQLRRRGGSKMTLWVVSRSSNFDTDITDSVSYESWHLQLKFETSLRSLRLILLPQEVSEVTEVKVKKIWDEIPRIANFWLTEM